MTTISTKLPASKVQSEVARYLDLQLQAMASVKNASRVADEAGFPQRNLLSMIRSGQTKLPFERIDGLAKALEINKSHLFRLALKEYQPAIEALLAETGRQVISQHEQQLLTAWRDATDDSDPSIEQFQADIETLGKRACALAREVGRSQVRGNG